MKRSVDFGRKQKTRALIVVYVLCRTIYQLPDFSFHLTIENCDKHCRDKAHYIFAVLVKVSDVLVSSLSF